MGSGCVTLPFNKVYLVPVIKALCVFQGATCTCLTFYSHLAYQRCRPSVLTCWVDCVQTNFPALESASPLIASCRPPCAMPYVIVPPSALPSQTPPMRILSSSGTRSAGRKWVQLSTTWLLGKTDFPRTQNIYNNNKLSISQIKKNVIPLNEWKFSQM